jgi:hypothetical protein
MYINALAHCPVIAHSDMFKEFLEYDQVNHGKSHMFFFGVRFAFLIWLCMGICCFYLGFHDCQDERNLCKYMIFALLSVLFANCKQ